jgi:tetratricopeptide (TPR) repeat protein
MPTGSELLKQAYALAENGKTDSAIKVLERIVKIEPQRVEAWEFYLQLCTSKTELNQIAKRISSNSKIEPDDKEDVLRYYRFLLQGKKESAPLSSKPGGDRQFYWYIIPAIFICLLIFLGWNKIDQVMDFKHHLSGVVIFIIALLSGLYFLRVMYLQTGNTRKQGARRYANTTDRLQLKPQSKHPEKK